MHSNWPLAPERRHPDGDIYNGVDPRNRGGGHIEGYRGVTKGGPTPQWQVGCTLYLDDVEPGGGSTYVQQLPLLFLLKPHMALRSFVWPKSHLAVHRYFKEYPEDIPTAGRRGGAAARGGRGRGRV